MNWLQGILSHDVFSCQGKRPVHHDLLAESGRHDVVATGERLEDTLGHKPSQRLEQQLFAHQRHAAADDEATRAEQGDHLANGTGQVEQSSVKNAASDIIALRDCFHDVPNGYAIRVSTRKRQKDFRLVRTDAGRRLAVEFDSPSRRDTLDWLAIVLEAMVAELANE